MNRDRHSRRRPLIEVGDSSPLLNVVWGSVNFLIAYVLLAKTQPMKPGISADALVLGVGGLVTALVLAVYFS